MTRRDPLELTEAQFLRQLVDLAAILGWHYVHFRPAQTSHGSRTPVQGPLGKGWPDLLLIHPERKRTMFRELKADAGHLSPEQREVIVILTAAGLDAGTWKPADLDSGRIVAELQG